MSRNIYYEFMQDLLADTVTVPHLLLTDYPHLGLTEKELVVLLRILRFRPGQVRLQIADIAAEFGVDKQQAAAIVQPFVARDLLTGDAQKGYSCAPLFSQLHEGWVVGKADGSGRSPAVDKNLRAQGLIYRRFEKELGKPLSPMQNEKIAHWLDEEHLDPELICEALRRAVLQGKISFAYIDRILDDWQQKGFRSVADVTEGDARPAKEPPRRTAKDAAKDNGKEELYARYRFTE